MENFDEYLRQGEPNKAEKAKEIRRVIFGAIRISLI